MKRMLANNVAGARPVVLTAVLATLVIGGSSLSTRANASAVPREWGGRGHGDHTVGQHNTTISHHSPTKIKGFQNSAPTNSGGQMSTMNAFCRKAPCRISQRVNMLPWKNVSAFIALSPTDFLVIP